MAAEALFQKSLQDLIKGTRQQRKDGSSFLSQAILEIKNELKSNDPHIKAEAVRKITYLQMVGFNVSWASFAVVEVMSQARFAHKRIGYLAANQVSTCFCLMYYGFINRAKIQILETHCYFVLYDPRRHLTTRRTFFC
jgi:uncharacterized membrane protein